MKLVWKTIFLFFAIFLIFSSMGCKTWTKLTLFNDNTRVKNFRNFHTIFPSEAIKPGDSIWAFESNFRPLPGFYIFEGQQRRIDAFLEETSTTGFAVARDGELLHEAYFSEYGKDSLPTSFSVAKSFVSALVGIAIEKGYITSVWDLVESYVPALAGTRYGSISLHHLLTMSSGVDFDEDYANPRSDVNSLPVQVFAI